MAYNMRSLNGVGGWLLLLIATLWLNAAVNAVASVGFVALAGRQSLPAIRSLCELMVAVTAASALGCGYLAWRLVARQEPRTPRIAIAGLWLLALVPLAIELAGVALLSGPGGSPFGPVLDGGAIRPIAYAGVWTAYLLNSDRVANTYAHDEDDRVAAVFR